MTSDQGRPIFVVGCQRSGTTVLRLMLDSHPSIACGPETRFMTDFERITDSQWYRISRFGFPREYFIERARAYFGGFLSEYAASKGKTRWADKSPLYSLILDYLWELFPDAQVVHIIRDVRDVTASHRSAFGYLSALGAPRKWQRYIRTVRDAASTMPSDQYLEVRYEQLIGDKEGTMRTVLDFLGEPWDPTVLDFERATHDVSEYYWRESSHRRAGSVKRRRLDPLLTADALLLSQPTRRSLGY